MMMALKSPLIPSPNPNNNLISAFSPYTDSPTSPRPFRSSPVIASMPAEHSGFLHPPQSSPLASSPSDIQDPSPIAPSSNGTDTTDIEDAGLDAEEPESAPERGPSARGSPRPVEVDLRLDTDNVVVHFARPSSDEDEQPKSVIHAPQSFELFHARRSPPSVRRSTPTPSQRSDITAFSSGQEEQSHAPSPVSPPPITTTVPPARDWSATPRAQTRSEAEAEADKQDHERPKLIPHSSSLEDIPEGQDPDATDDLTPSDRTTRLDHTAGQLQETADEVASLKLALSECWTLCNTLAGLSSIHRDRIIRHAGKGDAPEQAWKSCWKLCRKLYDTRDEDFAAQVRPTLDLCRDFCQSLFEVRQRENDVADSVLRVSFELNNHLYNTHDRTLPEAFRERTLDFYITLCHRLMKQRRRLAAETDSLLRACWSLAEMLFSLRQNQREGKPADEELLGSAVQACWELCDLFREGWTQVKPLSRGTPRPSQTTFTQAFQQAKRTERTQRATTAVTSAAGPVSGGSMDANNLGEDSAGESEDEEFGRLHPETPTTIFEDTQQISPDETSMPNILVLGPDQASSVLTHAQRQKWSSGASTLSGYSQGSGTTTSSTSTIINPTEDPRLTCLKLLIVKAAMNSGFQRGSSMTLAAFVKSIPSNSFGHAPWQMQLLENYKKLVASDPGFRSPGPSRRATAGDVGQAVRWMAGSGQYGWLTDLFRLVFGFHVDEGEVRSQVTIQS